MLPNLTFWSIFEVFMLFVQIWHFQILVSPKKQDQNWDSFCPSFPLCSIPNQGVRQVTGTLNVCETKPATGRDRQTHRGGNANTRLTSKTVTSLLGLSLLVNKGRRRKINKSSWKEKQSSAQAGVRNHRLTHTYIYIHSCVCWCTCTHVRIRTDVTTKQMVN